MKELRIITLMILIIIFNSCDEPEHLVQVERHKHVQLKPNERYVYHTGSWDSVEEGKIVFAPGAAAESCFKKDSADIELLYIYIPQKDYVGTDWVKLEFGAEGMNGTEALRTTVDLAITISE